MGRSSKKGNSGYIGVDKRDTTTGTTIGNVSIRKHFLERKQGNFAPVVDTNVLFEDDFNSGGFSKWTVANDSATPRSNWHTGSAEASTGGTGTARGAYISDDFGVTAQYYGSSQRDSHIYFDFDVPADAVSLTLSFDWKCNGESSFDYGYVNYWNTSSTPVAGTEYTSTTDRIGPAGGTSGRYNDTSNPAADTDWVTESLTIDGTTGNGPNFAPGTTQRIVFSWTNDSSVENNPGFCIDNVKLVFNT